uniref:Mite group 2 allergen Lep d 2 n=2 Tax=Culex pipiens TaxID=7175 RepID=A0A8D7ZZL4_CULPI
MLKFILVVLVPVLVKSDSASFRACPNGAPAPASVTIQGCSVPPCILRRGQTLKAEVRGIVSPVSTENVQAYTRISLGGVSLGIVMPEELVDACKVIQCPVEAGVALNYTFSYPALYLPILHINVKVRFGLQAGTTQIGCVEFDGIVL